VQGQILFVIFAYHNELSTNFYNTMSLLQIGVIIWTDFGFFPYFKLEQYIDFSRFISI
jgi:hypothetical protein